MMQVGYKGERESKDVAKVIWKPPNPQCRHRDLTTRLPSPLQNFISSQRQALQPGRNRSYFSVKNLDRKPTFSHLNRNFPCSICFVCLFCPKPFFFLFSEHITKPPQFLQMLLMQISIYCMCSFNGFSNRSQHPGKRVHGTMSSRAPAMLRQVGPQAASPFWQETYER